MPLNDGVGVGDALGVHAGEAVSEAEGAAEEGSGGDCAVEGDAEAVPVDEGEAVGVSLLLGDAAALVDDVGVGDALGECVGDCEAVSDAVAAAVSDCVGEGDAEEVPKDAGEADGELMPL